MENVDLRFVCLFFHLLFFYFIGDCALNEIVVYVTSSHLSNS